MTKKNNPPCHMGQRGQVQVANIVEKIAHLLGKGKEKREGDGWMTLCPAHEDHEPSLSIRVKENKLLVHCFGSCPQEKVIAKLKELGLWPEFTGLTLEELARAKHLDQAFLEQVFKLSNTNHKGKNAVLIPYLDEEGKEVSKRFRIALTALAGDNRFLWEKGAKLIPYGLWLTKIKETDYVILVEGESDTWTLAYHGFPCLGIPGKSSFRPEWAKYLRGFKKVYIWQEPEAQDFTERIAKHVKQADIYVIDPEKVGLEGIKDPSELHIYCAENGQEFRQAFELVLKGAEAYHTTGKKAKSQKKENVKYASFLIHDNFIYEQVLRDDKTFFIKYNPKDDTHEVVEDIITENNVVLPFAEEEVFSQTVLLPNGLEEYGTTSDLLSEIQAYIHKYLDVSELYEKIATYYILLSYLYDKYNTLPYLRALGDTGCGKSRFLDVIGTVCYKASMLSGAMTSAAIFRIINKYHGTLIIDEADITNSDEYNEIVKILNCGFERNRPILRAVKEHTDSLKIYNVYGPKVLATRGRFKDPALEARCLTEIMTETTRVDIPDVLTSDFYEERERLRNKLTWFRLRNLNKPTGHNCLKLEVEPRLRQIAYAFGSIFADDPQALEALRKFILTHQTKLIEERSETLPGRIVNAIHEILKSSENPITFVTNVTDATNLFVTAITAQKIEELTKIGARTVGRVFRTLRLTTHLTRLNGKVSRFLVYERQLFRTLFKRYVICNGCNICNVSNGIKPVGDSSQKINTQVNEIIEDLPEL